MRIGKFSVGPVGAGAAWSGFAFDCGVDVAAVEEREVPIEGAGVWASEAVGYRDCANGYDSVGIAYREIERGACAVCSLIGCGKILSGAWQYQKVKSVQAGIPIVVESRK